MKITKREHAIRGFVGIYNVEILNSFNPKLQLEDTKSAIKSKVLDFLSELKCVNFVTTLVLLFKKIES